MNSETIVVTGGTGFVGSNLVNKLNQNGFNRIIIVDDYDERKFKNIKDSLFIDFISYKHGIDHIEKQLNQYSISYIIHIGANADVLIKDADLMLNLNYEHSRFYLNYCLQKEIPLIYASSSAVYGNSKCCEVNQKFEDPHNVYAWSKWMFDKLIFSGLDKFKTPVIGLRFFNIFGMGEFHKRKNASLPFRFYQFLKEDGFIGLFDQEILRDYVCVDDVTSVIIDLMKGNWENGIYNLGSGCPISHQELASIVVDIFIERGVKMLSEDLIRPIQMPEDLLDTFQFFTKAEGISPGIKKYTTGNKEKIRDYINRLIDSDIS
jgi:ADP-L-glycero-D-manno-heptose 6-epimerase